MQTKEIKTKIKAVGNIQKITKTMEMVSVAKMKRAAERSKQSNVYSRHALETLVRLSEDTFLDIPGVTAPSEDATKATLVVIVGSNKGLCGPYNMNVSRVVASLCNHSDTPVHAVCLGKQAEKIARRNHIEVIASFERIVDHPSTDQIIGLYDVINEQFTEGNYDQVQVVYTRYIKPMNYQALAKTILPLRRDVMTDVLVKEGELVVDEPQHDNDDTKTSAVYTYEPDAETIYKSILPSLLQAVVFQMILDSIASEHSSRMIAMKGASDNASGLLDELTLTYNKARQEAITREISEIAAGADAIAG